MTATGLWIRGLALAASLLALSLTSAMGEQPTGGDPSLDPELLKQIQEAQEQERDTLAEEASAIRASREEALQREQEVAEAETRERAVEAARLRREVSGQLNVQAELMKRAQNDSEETPADPALNAEAFLDTSYLADADPRTATAAPLMRELPDEIFDEEQVLIQEQTWGDHPKLRLTRQILDADGDGAPELQRYLEIESRELVRQEDDRDYDGRMDAWIDFEREVLVRRNLDTTKDGRPDSWERYRAGWLAERDIDRDSDDIRDVFLVYENGELVTESHDSNNDTRIDLIISYRDRLRVHSEEDRDHDGRMDFWTFYRPDDKEERVHRVEHDSAGRGFADVFDIFEIDEGELFLNQRNSDVDGDGEIDVMRFYRRGKLVRMEVADAEVM